MKIAQIKSLKRPVIICELPEGCRVMGVYEAQLAYQHSVTQEKFMKQLPPGSREPLGWMTELKEEQLSELVGFAGLTVGLQHKDYTNKKPMASSARSSFLSAVEAEGWYWENPHGDKPERTIPFKGKGNYTDNDMYRLADFLQEEKAWQAAQEKVLDRERCFVIVNKGNL